MKKLKFISSGMVITGFILLLCGIALPMKELMEYGLCLGIAGIVAYAVMFIMRSTSTVEQESIFD